MTHPTTSSGHRAAYLYVILAAALWGTLGIYGKIFSAVGLSSLEIVYIRAMGAAVELVILLALIDRRLLRVRLQDLKYFIGTGILSFTFFNWCYFTAVRLTSLTVASILLYTAPALVMLISARLFHEKLTGRKVGSLILTFMGCVLVTGVLGGFGALVSPGGLLAGLGAGLGYALYSIFGKYALRRYHDLTVTAYTFIVAAAGLTPFVNLQAYSALQTDAGLLGLAIALSLLGTVAPFLLYTFALNRIEAGKASVTATLEPVVATGIGVLVYGEGLTAAKLLGIVMVLAAIVLLSRQDANH